MKHKESLLDIFLISAEMKRCHFWHIVQSTMPMKLSLYVRGNEALPLCVL